MGFPLFAEKQQMCTKCHISLNKAPALTVQSSPKLSIQVSTLKRGVTEKLHLEQYQSTGRCEDKTSKSSLQDVTQSTTN
jgi:hypothetical protein